MNAALSKAVLIFVALSAPVWAFPDDRPPRQVVVTDAEGRVHSGLLTELRAGQLTLKGADQARLSQKGLVLLKFADRTSIANPVDPVLLAGGDIFALVPEVMDDETLTARWARFAAWPPVKVPLENLRALLVNPPANAGPRLFSQALDYREPQDSVMLLNGDTLSGQIASLDDKQLLLETGQGKSAIERSGIEAVFFNPSLAAGITFQGEGALVSLIDGSRLRAQDLKLAGLERITMRTLFGAELSIPISAIESLRFLGGCATYLSDLEPTEYKFEPFLSLDWPLRADRNVTGGVLRLRGVEFPKGLGVHSRSTVTYRLDGKFRRFHAVIGIDDATSGAGSATFEVLLDGKNIYRSGVLTGTSPAADIGRIDVSGSRRLTLRVDYATQGDIQDHADWAEAVLIR